jgi:hypothetical protein
MGELAEFPRGVPDVADGELVQVLMTRQQARAFARRCLPITAELVGPLVFSDDDLPTFMVGVTDAAVSSTAEG